jgi:hypothetical protein
VRKITKKKKKKKKVKVLVTTQVDVDSPQLSAVDEQASYEDRLAGFGSLVD